MSYQCKDCFKEGNIIWANWHKEHTDHLVESKDEPPSKSHKDFLKLHILGSRDLCCSLLSCQPLLAGNNSFRSLVYLGKYR